MELLINLFPPYFDIFRRFNSDLHVVTLGAENGYLDIVIDDDGFVLTSGEYEYPAPPWSCESITGRLDSAESRSI